MEPTEPTHLNQTQAQPNTQPLYLSEMPPDSSVVVRGVPASLPIIAARRAESWSAALQNLGALTAVTWLTLADKLSGDVAAGMILAVVGVITLPALRRNPSSAGSVGIGMLAVGAIGMWLRS